MDKIDSRNDSIHEQYIDAAEKITSCNTGSIEVRTTVPIGYRAENNYTKR